MPEAVVNFLALLGWNPGTEQELLSMEELIKLFNIEKCSKAGAKFDYEKGKWFNHKYIQEKSDAEIAEMFIPILKEKKIDIEAYNVEKIVSLVKSRINFAKDLWAQTSFFFEAPQTYAEKDIRKRWKEGMPQIITELVTLLEGEENFASAALEEVVLSWIAKNEYHLGNTMNAFRLAVVGECRGPHMFDITEVIGKEETIARLKTGLDKIKPVE